MIRCGFMWNPWVYKQGPDAEDDYTGRQYALDRHPNERSSPANLVSMRSAMGIRPHGRPSGTHGFGRRHVEEREYPWIYTAFRTGMNRGGEYTLWNRDLRRFCLARGPRRHKADGSPAV